MPSRLRNPSESTPSSRVISATERPVETGIRDWYDDVGVDRRLARKLPAEPTAGRRYAVSERHAIRPRKVHELEHALCGERLWPLHLDAQRAGVADDQEFGRIDV